MIMIVVVVVGNGCRIVSTASPGTASSTTTTMIGIGIRRIRRHVTHTTGRTQLTDGIFETGTTAGFGRFLELTVKGSTVLSRLSLKGLVTVTGGSTQAASRRCASGTREKD